MCTNATDAVEGTDLEPRDVRALTEYLTVDDDTEDRPDDCNCGPVTVGESLPCWPCYRDGFSTPADVNDEE